MMCRCRSLAVAAMARAPHSHLPFQDTPESADLVPKQQLKVYEPSYSLRLRKSLIPTTFDNCCDLVTSLPPRLRLRLHRAQQHLRASLLCTLAGTCRPKPITSTTLESTKFSSIRPNDLSLNWYKIWLRRCWTCRLNSYNTFSHFWKLTISQRSLQHAVVFET